MTRNEIMSSSMMNCFDPFIFTTLFFEKGVILLISNENVRKKPNDVYFWLLCIL